MAKTSSVRDYIQSELCAWKQRLPCYVASGKVEYLMRVLAELEQIERDASVGRCFSKISRHDFQKINVIPASPDSDAGKTAETVDDALFALSKLLCQEGLDALGELRRKEGERG